MIGADDVNIEKFGRHLPPIVGKQLVLKLVEQYVCDKPTFNRVGKNLDCACVPSIERFHGAMLFVDISGFTALSQRLNVDELRIHINGYFKKILDIVFKFNGEVVKFAGDALFIVWQTKSSSTEGEQFEIERRKAVASASACGMEVNQTCSRYKVSFLEQNMQDSWLASALTSSKTTKTETTHSTASYSTDSADNNTNNPKESFTFLNVHAGVSVGTMAGIDVGANDRWEYLLVGEPLVSVAKAESEAAVAELVISPEAHSIIHEFSREFNESGFPQYCQHASECHATNQPIPLLPCGCQITPGGFFKVNQTITGGSNMDAEDEPDPEYDLAFYAELMSNVTTAYDTMKPFIYENYNTIVERQLAGWLENEGGGGGKGSLPAEVSGVLASCTMHSKNDKDDKLFSHYLHWVQSCIVDDLVRHVHEADRGTFALKQLNRVMGLTALVDKNLKKIASNSSSNGTATTPTGQKSPRGGDRSPRGVSTALSGSTSSSNGSVHISTRSSASAGPQSESSGYYTAHAASISASSVSGKLSGSASTDSFVSKIRNISDNKHRNKRKFKHDRTLKQDATLTAELRSVMVLFIKLDIEGSIELFVDPARPSMEQFSAQEQENLKLILQNNRQFESLALAPSPVVIEGYNFLKRTEREMAEDLQLLNKFQSCMEVMTRIFLHKGGQMRQFIVDDKGTVCIGTFGLRGAANSDNAAAAIETAQDIIDQLSDIGIRSGVGITSGKAYCGLVGSSQRHEYAVMGPSTNLSARLMAKSDWGEILCSEEARTRDRTHAFDSCGTIKAKGYELPVPIFKPLVRLHAEETAEDLMHRQSSIVGASLLADNFRRSVPSFDAKDPHAGVSTPERLALQQQTQSTLQHPQQQQQPAQPRRHSTKKRHRSLCVGREDETESVLAFLAPQIFPDHVDLENFTGTLPLFDLTAPTRLCVVQANSGIGKSNFIESIAQKMRDLIRTDRKVNFSLFPNKSSSFHSAEPFASWKPIVDRLLSNVAPRDTSIKSREQLLIAGLDHLAESMSEEMRQLKPLLSSVYLVKGLTENETTKKLSGAAKLAKVSELIAALIQQYVNTTKKVAIFMMDDLHAFDSASWQLLKKIYTTNTGIMVLGSYPVMTLSERDTSCDSLRKDFADKPDQYLMVELEAFEEESTQIYCQYLMEEHSIIGVTPNTFSLIHEIAGGNPLYIGELVAAFADRFKKAAQHANDISKVSGSMIFTEMIKTFSAVRIEEVIFFRFDQLEPACQLLLKLASVVCANGARFNLSILSYMMREDDNPNAMQSVDESRGIRSGGIFQLVRSMSSMGSGLTNNADEQREKAQQLNATNFCLLKTIKTLLKRREFVQIASSGTSSAGSGSHSSEGKTPTAGNRRGSKFVDTKRSAIRTSLSSDADLEDEQAVMIDTLEVNNDEDAEYFHTLEFEFRVHLEQVSVYSLMLNDQKESLHDRVASYLESKSLPNESGVVLLPPRPSSLHEEAFHWEHAANWSAAMSCYYRSALILESVGAFEENFAHLTDAYRMLNAMRRDAGVNESAMTVVVPETFKILFTNTVDSATATAGSNSGKASGTDEKQNKNSVETDLMALTFRYKANMAAQVAEQPTRSASSTTLTKELISKIFYADCDLLELGINVLVKLAQVSLILTYRFAIISRLYEEALQMILCTMSSESLFGKGHNPPVSSLKANGALGDGVVRSSPPKRRTSFHVGAHSFSDMNEFGLRDPTMCFPILSGISALYRNNLLPDDANHSKEVTVYNLFLTLAQSSPLPIYRMHLLIGFSFKRSIYADVNKRQESIHYCDIIRQAYDYDMHSAEAVKIYGNDRIPYTFAMNIQLLMMQGQIVRALNYLEYTCELIPRVAHLHSQGITVLGICWLMVTIGKSQQVYEMYRNYVDGLETRRVFSFFNPTNALFVAWLKLETLLDSYNKDPKLESLIENEPCEKEQEVMELKFYKTGENRPVNMFALDSFGTNTEFVCARMCLLRARIRILTNKHQKDEEKEAVLSLLRLAVQYVNHGIACNGVNLKNAFGTFSSLLLKAEILKEFADFLVSSGNNEGKVLAEQMLTESREAVVTCMKFGQEQAFDFICVSAGAKWRELGFSSLDDEVEKQVVDSLSKISHDTQSAAVSAAVTLSEDLVKNEPYFMIGEITAQASFESLVAIYPSIGELREKILLN